MKSIQLGKVPYGYILVDDIDLKTSSRTLEKFITLNNLELNYTFIA